MTEAPAVPLITRPLLAARLRLRTPVELDGLMLILPVVAPPSVSVLFLRLWIVDVEASKTRPLPLVDAEIVAWGVPAAIPLTANKAEEVEVPPRARSNVELEGESKFTTKEKI